jgi:hypothetical protein
VVVWVYESGGDGGGDGGTEREREREMDFHRADST